VGAELFHTDRWADMRKLFVAFRNFANAPIKWKYTRMLLHEKHKATMYKTLIKPVLMYGAKTWVLNKVDELRLGVFERKILRRIYGPICEEAVWRSRYNEELRGLEL